MFESDFVFAPPPTRAIMDVRRRVEERHRAETRNVWPTALAVVLTCAAMGGAFLKVFL